MDHHEIIAPGKVNPLAGGSSGKHILLVEENLNSAELIIDTLKADTYFSEVTHLCKAEKAIKMLQDNHSRFTLIVSDYKLPLMNGLDFFMSIKSERYNLPFVILAGAGSEAIAVKALKSGVQDYIVKDAERKYLKYLANRLIVAVSQYQDTKKQKLEEVEVKKTVDSYKLYLNSVMEGISFVDKNETFQYCNPACAEIFEVDGVDELIGKSVMDYVDENDRQLVLDQSINRSAGRASQYELKITTAKSNKKSILISGTPKYDETGEFIGSVGALIDITARKSMEEELRENEKRYRALFERTNDAVFIFGLDDIHLEVNQPAADMLGYSIDELVGKPLTFFTKPSEHKDGDKVTEALLAGKTVPIYERTFIKKDGSELVAEINIALVRDKEGQPKHFQSIVRNVTERKQAEKELADQKQRLANILRGTNVGTWEWNVQTGETIFNERWAEIIGYTLSELSPVSIDTWLKYCHPDDLKISNELLTKHFNGELDYYESEARMRHKNGHFVWVLDRGKVASWTDDGKPHLMFGTHQDITARKRAEDALKVSEEQFKQLFETAQEGIAMADNNHRLIHINREFTRIFGYSEKEAIGRLIDELLIPENKMNEIKNLMGQVTEGHQAALESTRRCKDGTLIDVSILTSPIVINGEQVGVYGIYRNITQRKQAEKEIKKYAETQKVLVQEVNHRVKNNLSAIISMIHMEEERVEAENIETTLPVLKRLVARVRGLSTVHTLLSAGEWRPLMLHQLCRQILKVGLQSLPHTKKIECDVAESDIKVNSNQAHHLGLVINELLTNSIKHTLNDRNSARISIGFNKLGSKISICFKDDGPGYPAKMVDGDYSRINAGFEMIRGIVTKTLGGEVLLKNENGAVTILTFDF